MTETISLAQAEVVVSLAAPHQTISRLISEGTLATRIYRASQGLADRASTIIRPLNVLEWRELPSSTPTEQHVSAVVVVPRRFSEPTRAFGVEVEVGCRQINHDPVMITAYAEIDFMSSWRMEEDDGTLPDPPADQVPSWPHTTIAPVTTPSTGAPIPIPEHPWTAAERNVLQQHGLLDNDGADTIGMFGYFDGCYLFAAVAAVRARGLLCEMVAQPNEHVSLRVFSPTGEVLLDIVSGDTDGLVGLKVAARTLEWLRRPDQT